jgi:hypothetical protein
VDWKIASEPRIRQVLIKKYSYILRPFLELNELITKPMLSFATKNHEKTTEEEEDEIKFEKRLTQAISVFLNIECTKLFLILEKEVKYICKKISTLTRLQI